MIRIIYCSYNGRIIYDSCNERIIYDSYNERIILLVVYLYVAEAATLLTAHYTIEALTLIIR